MTNPSPSNPELLPCPFCGACKHPEAIGIRWEEEPDDLFFVVCERCGGKTMGGDTEAEAITAWNQRINLPSDGAVGELVRLTLHYAAYLRDHWADADGTSFHLHCADCITEAATTLTRLAAGREADAKRIEALEEYRNRVEEASRMFHNVEHWHGEPAPDGDGSLFDWVERPVSQALSPGKDG